MKKTTLGIALAVAIGCASLAGAQQDFYYDLDSVYTVEKSPARIAVKFDPQSASPHSGSAFYAAHPCLTGGSHREGV